MADTPAVNFTATDVNPAFNISFSNSAGGFDLGYKFTVTAPVTVTQLGYYNGITGGMFMSHEVGLYNAAGELLASTTVLPSDPLTEAFRYHSIIPVNLLAPGDYVLSSVAGYDPGNPVDLYTHDPNVITFDPRITFIGNRVLGGQGNNLVFLTDADTEVSINPPLHYGWFGPNLQMNNIDVPEPMTMFSLLGMGAVALKRKLKRDREVKANNA